MVAPDAGSRARRRAGRHRPVTGATRRAPAGKMTARATRPVPDERLRCRELTAHGDERKTERKRGRRSGQHSRRLPTLAGPRRVQERVDAGKPARSHPVSEGRARRPVRRERPVTGATHRAHAGKATARVTGVVTDERLRCRELAAHSDERMTERKAGGRSGRHSRRLPTLAGPRRVQGRGDTGKPARSHPVSEGCARRPVRRERPVAGGTHRAHAEMTAMARRTLRDEDLRTGALAARGDERKTGRNAGRRSGRLATLASPRRLRRRSDAGTPGRPHAVLETAPRIGLHIGLDTRFPTGLDTGFPTGLDTGFPTGLDSGFPTGLDSGFPAGLDPFGR